MIKSFLKQRSKKREMKKWETRITKNFKDLEIRRKLTKEQKKEVQEFYKDMIGRKVPLYCHEYFYSRTGYFTKEYIPNNLYHCELVPKANQHQLQSAFGDKNMCDLLFPGENIVHSILKNMNGYYYYEGKPVSEDDAVSLCQNMDNVIIKPSKLSEGKGVQLFSSKDGVTDLNGITVAQLFKDYRKNFIVQERVRQHKGMAALNPSSVNTIRVLSYRSEMEVLIIYSVVRIGRSGSVVDNQCAGGISTTIDDNGRLGKEAFGGFSKDNILKTDTGIILDGYTLPSYDKAIEFIKR